MEGIRVDGRKSPNDLRPLNCYTGVLSRAHGSARWSQGDTIVLAAVYGPKAGTKKNENPEKASIEVIWKPKTGQMGKEEKECEMILRRTMQSICLLTVNPNTTTSIILQVVNDDGALIPCAINAASAALVDAGIPLKHLAVAISCGLDKTGSVLLDPTKLEEQVVNDDGALIPCAINAASAALVDAGIPLKHLAVAISCGLDKTGSVLLDPTKLEEQTMQAFTYLVFPNSVLSVLPEHSLQEEGEKMEHGLITSVNHGVMSVDDYLHCLERGRTASAAVSNFMRRKLEPKTIH